MVKAQTDVRIDTSTFTVGPHSSGLGVVRS